MTMLDVPVPVLHPAQGGAVWVVFFACAVLLSGTWLARLWLSERSRERIRYGPADSAQPHPKQGDERVSGA